MKQGSYINIWVPRKEKEEDSDYEPIDFGYVNHAFKKSEDSQVVGLGFAPIEERIEDCCRKFKINYITKTEKHSLYDTIKYKKVTFDDKQLEKEKEEEEEDKSEGPYVMIQLYVPNDVLEDFCIGLQDCGVGAVPETGFSVLPTSVNIFSGKEETKEAPSHVKQNTKKSFKKKISFYKSSSRLEKFYKSIKSRLIVAEVIKRIESGAEFSFDFVTYLVAAAAIAFMGLVENSTVSLVASMLISPLMGPILAIVFGHAIKNKKLLRTGLKRELYALSICVLCGFLFGCIFVLKFNRSRNLLTVPTSSLEWPTKEILSRTGWSCLVVGVCVAIPSGVGVALAVLGGNQAGGVGVAISASLLPPAVNTGLLFAMSLISYITDTHTESSDKFEFEYSEGNIPLELFLRGLVSLCLTIVNILGILLFGVWTLYIKQVTPLSIPQKNATFWTKDVQLNKEYEKSIQSELREEGAEFGLSEKELIEELFQEAANDQHVIESRKWVEVNYPSDDLDTYRDEDVITIDCGSQLSEPNTGRFQVTKMRSMRRGPVTNITSIVQEEVRNAAHVFERRLSQEVSQETAEPAKKKTFFNADNLRGITRSAPPNVEFVHIV